MKKIIALVLALVMILSLATVAFADESTKKPTVNLSNISELIAAGKEMLAQAKDFTSLLKSGLATINSIRTNLGKIIQIDLPGLDVINKIITTVSTSVDTLYNNLGSLSSLIKNMEKLNKLFGDMYKYFPLQKLPG